MRDKQIPFACDAILLQRAASSVGGHHRPSRAQGGGSGSPAVWVGCTGYWCCHRGRHSSTAATIAIGCSWGCACNPGACRRPGTRSAGENHKNPSSISTDHRSRSSFPLSSARLHRMWFSYWLLLIINVSCDMMRQMKVNALLLLTRRSAWNWISECLDSRRAHSMPCVKYCMYMYSSIHPACASLPVENTPLAIAPQLIPIRRTVHVLTHLLPEK